MAVILPSWLARDLPGQSTDGDEQFLSARSSNASSRARAQSHLYVLSGWTVVLSVSDADVNWHFADVLLRAINRSRLYGHEGPRVGGKLRNVDAQRASVGGTRDGHHGVLTYVPSVLYGFI